MRYFILLLILIGFVGIAFAMHEPNDPNTHPTMPQMQNDPNTIKQFHSQYDKIEFIGGKPFFVSEKYDANPVSNETITFHGVNFTHPSYPEIPNPGGFVSTAVTFEDGTKKSVSVGFTSNPIPVLTERRGVFAGMMRDSDGLHFLVSANLTKISPLKQFKSGIESKDVVCKPGLELVMKKSNGQPICVKGTSMKSLTLRGYIPEYNGALGGPIPTDDENKITYDTIIVDGKTYYFTIINETMPWTLEGKKFNFHDVIFTLFPQPFNGGLPVDSCDGSNGGRYYWINAKFSDGTNELLHIFINSKPCLDDIPIIFGNHTNPQTGLSFSNNRMKLLVSTDSDLVVPRPDLFLQQPLRIEGLNDTYSVGQKIEFTVKFNGTKYGCYTHPTLRIENSEHQIIWESNHIVELCDPDTTPTHFEKIWNTSNSNLGVPILNKTGTYTLFAEFEKNIIQQDFSVNLIESASDEISASSYICFNHDLSSNSTGVYLTCHNEEYRNIVYDLPDPVYKREDCKSTYGCASKYVWIPQIPKELISEEYKKQILEKVLNLPETKNWPAKSKLDHFNIGTSVDRWEANIQFFVAGFKLPQHNHCEFYDSVNIDLETMEVTSGFRNFTNFEKC